MTDRLLLSGVAGLLCGILASSLATFGFAAVGFVILITLLLAVVWLRTRASALLLSIIFFACASCGMLRVELVPSALPNAFTPLVGTRAALDGTIVADPDVRERTQRLTIEITQEGETTRILAVTSLEQEFAYGERVRVRGTPVYPEPFETDANRTFAYDKFLAKDSVFLVVPFADVERSGEREGVWLHLRGSLSDLKFAGMDALSRALPEPHASLAAGLILGGKQGLGESLLDDFIASGLVHIVVLSGYNVMIVADAFMRAFSVVSKSAAASAAGVTVALFVLAAGAGPASIRAGIMALIALYGRATGRTNDAFRALLAAAVLMLLWNPLTLAFDPGFQLSFLATLGLIFGAPIVERWLRFIVHPFMRDIIASTIAAQIAVLPLLLYQNGLLSLVALPANILVLPFVPLAMLFSFVALLAGHFVPIAASLAGFPAYALLSYIIGVVETSAALPLAAFFIPSFPFLFVILAYVALFFLVRHLR